MKKLSPTELPEEYHYYRSHARSYANYLVHSQGSWTVLVDEVEWFGYITHYCFGLFSYAVFEKSDIEPTRELLQKYGMKRGLVLWSGWHRDHFIPRLVRHSLCLMFRNTGKSGSRICEVIDRKFINYFNLEKSLSIRMLLGRSFILPMRRQSFHMGTNVILFIGRIFSWTSILRTFVFFSLR